MLFGWQAGRQASELAGRQGGWPRLAGWLRLQAEASGLAAASGSGSGLPGFSSPRDLLPRELLLDFIPNQRPLNACGSLLRRTRAGSASGLFRLRFRPVWLGVARRGSASASAWEVKPRGAKVVE